METSSARRHTRPHLAATGAKQAHPTESGAPSSSLLTSTSVRACAGIRPNGNRCRARASAGHDFCTFHRADLQEALRAGRVLGGRQRRYVPLNDLEQKFAVHLSLGLDSRGGIQAGLDNLLRLAFIGRVSPRYISALTRIYATALRNLEKTDRDTEDHTFGAYFAGLVANHRLQLDVELAAREEKAAAERAGRDAAEAIRKLIEECETGEPGVETPGSAASA